MRRQTKIFSIFGQIEAVIARAMIDEGKGRYIDPRAIPSSVMFNDKNQCAQFAIVLQSKDIPEFEQRVADLRI